MQASGRTWHRKFIGLLISAQNGSEWNKLTALKIELNHDLKIFSLRLFETDFDYKNVQYFLSICRLSKYNNNLGFNERCPAYAKAAK